MPSTRVPTIWFDAFTVFGGGVDVGVATPQAESERNAIVTTAREDFISMFDRALLSRVPAIFRDRVETAPTLAGMNTAATTYELHQRLIATEVS